MRNKLIDEIVSKEWVMFRNGNSSNKKSICQENPIKFFANIKAQYISWPQNICELHLRDMNKAIEENRNIVEEKYIRMQQYIYPEIYESYRNWLPAISDEKEQLCNELCEKLVSQFRDVYKKYPFIAALSRPLLQDETDHGISYQAYQMCELQSYSIETLQELKKYIYSLESRGISFAEIMQRNNSIADGFENIDEAEYAAKIYLSNLAQED